MAVYREGYSIISQIQSSSKQIWNDSCDYGVLVKKNDPMFNLTKQLVDWYQVENSRKQDDYSTGVSVNVLIELMDEWAYSDGRKTEEESIDMFSLTYHTISDKKLNREGYIGYIYVEQISK